MVRERGRGASGRARRSGPSKAVITIAVVVIAATGVSVAVARAGSKGVAHTRAMVAIVGDSNVARGSGYLVQHLTFGPYWTRGNHLDNNYLVTFAVRSGSGIRSSDCPGQAGCRTHDFWKVKLATAFAKSTPDAIVTNLGINDTRTPGSGNSLGYADYDEKIDWFMQLLPPKRPVFWTNLPCAVEPADRSAGCATVNRALADARARWPNLTVVNWAKVANAHPEYMADRIHNSAAGYRAWAQLITRALDKRFPAG
jgi:hypothetical protein